MVHSLMAYLPLRLPCTVGLAICFQIETKTHELKWAKFAIFCFCNCMLNFGPNIATYVLPAIIYPYEVRSTFHGQRDAHILACISNHQYQNVVVQRGKREGVVYSLVVAPWWLRILHVDVLTC